ncbi:MAG: hypothetical protein IJF92_03385 [Bacilli bacterium]|nr:hypothetical protein [Bacilli bacterium]
MKKKSSNKNEEQISKINGLNILFVDIQVVLTVMTLIVAILVLLGKVSFKMFELSLGLNLLSIAFNNYKIYKRSKLTILYLILGIFLLICIGV